VTCVAGLRVSSASPAACWTIEDEVPSAKSLMALINTAFLSFCMDANYRPIGFEPGCRRFESVRAHQIQRGRRTTGQRNCGSVADSNRRQTNKSVRRRRVAAAIAL